MGSSDVAQQIAELENIRKQLRGWRIGSTAIVFIVVVGCVWTIINAGRGLVEEGPSRDKFANQLATDLQQETLPKVQGIAVQAIAEVQPLMQTEFEKLNERTPELSDAAMQQLDLLQQNLPEKGADVLGKTFGTTLDQLEPKIKTMFPDVNEDTVKKTLDQLTIEGTERMAHTHETLFGPHLKALESISTNIKKIQGSEPVNAQESQANWEMALLLVDLFHDDIKDLRDMDAKLSKAGAKNGAGKGAGGAKGAAVKNVATKNKPAASKTKA